MEGPWDIVFFQIVSAVSLIPGEIIEVRVRRSRRRFLVVFGAYPIQAVSLPELPPELAGVKTREVALTELYGVRQRSCQ